MKKRWLNNRKLGYVPVVAVGLLAALVAGWTGIATRIDNYAYDWMFGLTPPAPHPPSAVIVAIDDATFQSMGGVGGYRRMIAAALEQLHRASLQVIAIDVLLTDAGDPASDATLRAAMCATPNLVLAADLANNDWQEPLPPFASCATAIGHDTSDEDSRDGVTRSVPLEKRTARQRHWALSLEAFRLAHHASIIESPDDLQIGAEVIPARRTADENRPLRVRYSSPVPEVSVRDLMDHPDIATRLNGKVVFIGVTSLTAARDRVKTPVGEMPGVAVHAQLFETLAAHSFLVDASNLSVLAVCASIAIVTGLIFAFLSGWPAYALAAAFLAAVHFAPFLLFAHGVVLPYFGPLATVWLTMSAAATYQHFVVRRDLRNSEAGQKRYQQAFQWVTHEMRSPLTAIQGSSEIMGRYNLTDEKRKQIASTINAESKRLARMIQTFLDVERLSAGHMELKNEAFPIAGVIEICADRLRPLAERKQIQVHTAPDLNGQMNGDRELLEYAVYNLMTNAVKYSPPNTEIFVTSRLQGDSVRVAVQDQGIGMDSKELKNIFRKFYRTKRAEASGEAGTGIGLSIVEQIVQVHGGSIEVTSQVGKGSCFTMVLPAYSRVIEKIGGGHAAH